MEKETKNQKLKRLFTTHPSVNKFYLTSDGQAFFKENDADNHAKSLEDKEVVSISRSIFERAEQTILKVKEAIKDSPIFGVVPEGATIELITTGEGASDENLEEQTDTTDETTSEEQTEGTTSEEQTETFTASAEQVEEKVEAPAVTTPAAPAEQAPVATGKKGGKKSSTKSEA